MKFLNVIKTVIKKADFFKTKELVRYKSESDYSTVFGGIISILLIGLLSIVVSSKLQSFITKSQINTSQEEILEQAPSNYKLETFPRGNFMLAINIDNFDTLDQANQYFHMYALHQRKKWNFENQSWQKTSSNIPLERCTRDHWKFVSRMNNDKYYQSWEFQQMLCLPLNSSFQIEGDLYSDFSKQISIRVQPCETAEASLNLSCASKAKFYQWFIKNKNVDVRIYLVNSNVNPSRQDYVKYAMNYANVLTFNSVTSVYGEIYLQDYKIVSDESILPFSEQKIQTGASFSTNTVPKYRQFGQKNFFCQFAITRNYVSLKYYRSYLKFDEVLAFTGGLFGTMSLFLLIVNSYNNFAYLISLGSSLFKPEDQKELKTFKNYNFLSYLVQVLYKFLSLIGIYPEWKTICQYNKCKKQVEKQLDIQYILDRLSFLETSIFALLEEHHIKGIHLKGKITLKQAKKRRKGFKLKKQVKIVKSNLQKKLTRKLIPEKVFDEKDEKSECEGSQSSQGPLDKRYFVFSSNLASNKTQIDLGKIQLLSTGNPNDSQSSSDDEEFSQKSDAETEVLDVLNRLKSESDTGDRLSKRIFEITNSAIFKFLPDILSTKNLLKSLGIQTSNTDVSKQRKFCQIIQETEEIQEIRLGKGPQPPMSIMPKIRFCPSIEIISDSQL